MFSENKKKGQTSIEILAILGVLVIGGIILGTFYLSNINKKTTEAGEIANIDYNNWFEDNNFPLPVCPNGIVEAPEQCDGANMGLFAGKKCYDIIPLGGNAPLTCGPTCRIDISACTGAGTCGDHVVNTPSEQCDAPDWGTIGSSSCSDYNATWGGSITCNNCSYDLSACMYCGDGICNNGETPATCSQDCAAPSINCGNNKIEFPEECDGSNLNSQTCATQGYFGGTLSCYAKLTPNECKFDTTNCNLCGNKTCDKGETCLTCPSDCTCEKCGNGVIDFPPEQCDTNGPVIPPFLSCATFGYTGGTLGCTNRCKIDTKHCFSLSSGCGDGICSIPGECISCPADCNGEPGCQSTPNSIFVDVSPLSGTRQVNAAFDLDVNTLQTTPLTTRYTLKVDVTDSVTLLPSSNCRFNGGAYSSSITLDTNILPVFKNYNPFQCNTAGSYRLKFTATNDSNSADTAFVYSNWVINNAGTVATPIANPAGGTYPTAQSVTLTSATNGATIHYTIDGTTPTCSSNPIYASPINIPLNTTRTIKAIACKTGMTESTVMSETYIITATVATPIANPVGGTYVSAQNVTLTCSTSGSQIWYTIDNSTPEVNGATSNLYITGSPVFIAQNTTLKAKAFKPDWTPSAISADNYIITTDYCGDKTVLVYSEHHPYSNYCDPPIYNYLLASTGCYVYSESGSTYVEYSGITLNDAGIKAPYEGEMNNPGGIKFCEDHNFTFASGTASIVEPGTPWYLSIACTASGPPDTNQWEVGVAPQIGSRTYDSITCVVP